MKSIILILFLIPFIFQNEVEITHHRKDLKGKTLIGEYNFTIHKSGKEDNMDMINRGYDSARVKAKQLDGTMVYINGRRWRYLGRTLVVITEIYRD